MTRPAHEADIIRMLSEGLTSKQIAIQLGLSKGRVKNITTAILARHGAMDRIHLLDLLGITR